MPILRNRHFFLIDLALLPLGAVLAFALRLDAQGLARYAPAILLYAGLAVPVKLLVFRRLGIYRRMWRYASAHELALIAGAAGLGTLLTAALLWGVALPLTGVACPRSIPFIDGLLTLGLAGGPRFAFRLAWQRRRRGGRRAPGAHARPVLVVGAGDAGSLVVREMQANPQLGLEPVGFVDDDAHKHGTVIYGVPVLGSRARLPELARSLHTAEVIIAMPSAPGHTIREILALCEEAGVRARTVPSLYEILAGRVSISQLREVEIEDLLRREPVETDISAVERMLHGCRVLVTGAGGSIGSELCRQIARCGPAALILVGHGENSIFEVSNELAALWPELPVARALADIRDPERLAQVFAAHRPDVVFHAAAHKHVPLMEENAEEAVTNNVLGTAHLLQACEAHGVGRFVFISTDKAVNPSSVMGATKRVAELLVQDAARRCGRPWVAVRFGNVLGSRGSVVPLFRQQIARGGPVTVTHPEVERYFMTIPEAVQLVLQAAALGRSGEVFMLDMGEPVRIVDLAHDLIALSGLEVGRDVEVVYTGLRPGEKLHEELLVQGEEYAPTSHGKILVARNGVEGGGCPVDVPAEADELVYLARNGQASQIRAKLREIVPEYAPILAEAEPTDRIPGDG